MLEIQQGTRSSILGARKRREKTGPGRSVEDRHKSPPPSAARSFKVAACNPVSGVPSNRLLLHRKNAAMSSIFMTIS
jgi:hypothetical protein